MKMFLSTTDTQRSSEDQLQLISDARFAMGQITFDLRHAGLWGSNNATKLVLCGKGGALFLPCPAGDDMPTATSDCEPDWYIDISRPIFGEDNVSAFSATCATQGYKAGTDILGLHYADTIPVANTQLAADVAYIRSGSAGGQFFVGPTLPDMNWDGNDTARNFPYRSYVYYISDYSYEVGDGIPSLRRVELGVGPAMVDRLLIPGVEDIQFEYGIDTLDSTPMLEAKPAKTGKDSQVNAYVNAGTVNLDPENWVNGRVLTVKVWMLMRAERADRAGIGGNQTFALAGNAPVTYTDGIRRFLMTSVIRMRNTHQLDSTVVGG